MSLALLAGVFLVVIALAYRLYGGMIARRYQLGPAAETPAVRKQDGGDFVPTRSLIWCVGVKADPLVESFGLKTEQGRLVVDEFLTVPGHPEVYAGGDAAAAPDLSLTVDPVGGDFLARLELSGSTTVLLWAWLPVTLATVPAMRITSFPTRTDQDRTLPATSNPVPGQDGLTPPGRDGPGSAPCGKRYWVVVSRTIRRSRGRRSAMARSAPRSVGW